jgi:hypothetical protein
MNDNADLAALTYLEEINQKQDGMVENEIVARGEK